MRIAWISVTIVVLLLAGIFSCVLIMRAELHTDVDMVTANGLLKTVEQEWEQLDHGDYSDYSSDGGGMEQLPFVVLDSDGSLRYRSPGGIYTGMNDAIRNRDTILDVVVQGVPAGKLMIQHNDQAAVRHFKNELALLVGSTFAAIVLLCAWYAILINGIVFKPFRQLQRFAANVARGNLDLPLKFARNNPFGAFTESFDIMREELAAAREREYAANRSKKELIASLSHDIKTPVASIKAVSELMLVQAAGDKAIKQLGIIYSKAEQIDRLVTDMFHATLEELNELKVTVAEEMSIVLEEIIANVNIDDRIHCERVPPCILLTDAARLQQVFDNVVSNTYKYAGTPVTITFSVQHTHLNIHILDYGKGIHPDELPLVFNKFYRGNNAEGQSGSGLGLYISKYLMQRMGGDMECHNREDGLTVTLSIPLA